MKRRVVLAGLGLAAALSAPVWGAAVLRHVHAFDVRRVEVVGTRLLAPHEVLAASGVAAGQSVWQDLGVRRQALRAHPVVTDAVVQRVLPHTLQLRITELAPVALVEQGGLRMATAAGVVLPTDPARAAPDLPLVRTGAAGSAAVLDSVARRLLAQTGHLAGLHPALAGRVSEVFPAPGGAVRLVLSQPRAEVVLPPNPDLNRLQELTAVLNYLERQGTAGALLDLRWSGQVVVRVSPSVG